MNWKGCGKKQSCPDLRYHPGSHLGVLTITTNVGQGSQSPGQDVNMGPSQYEEMLTTRLWTLVTNVDLLPVWNCVMKIMTWILKKSIYYICYNIESPIFNRYISEGSHATNLPVVLREYPRNAKNKTKRSIIYTAVLNERNMLQYALHHIHGQTSKLGICPTSFNVFWVSLPFWRTSVIHFTQSVRQIGYGLDDQLIGVWFPTGQENCLLSTMSRLALGPPRGSSPWSKAARTWNWSFTSI